MPRHSRQRLAEIDCNLVFVCLVRSGSLSFFDMFTGEEDELTSLLGREFVVAERKVFVIRSLRERIT